MTGLPCLTDWGAKLSEDSKHIIDPMLFSYLVILVFVLQRFFQ